jgi:hypothetical protein
MDDSDTDRCSPGTPYDHVDRWRDPGCDQDGLEGLNSTPPCTKKPQAL